MVQKKIGQKRLKTSLTQGQKSTIFKLTVAFVFIALLWIIFIPQTGIYGFIKQKQELTRLQQKTVRLQEENIALAKEIDRLQNDPSYLEKIAREKYGLLKENERVYDFSDTKPHEKK